MSTNEEILYTQFKSEEHRLGLEFSQQLSAVKTEVSHLQDSYEDLSDRELKKLNKVTRRHSLATDITRIIAAVDDLYSLYKDLASVSNTATRVLEEQQMEEDIEDILGDDEPQTIEEMTIQPPGLLDLPGPTLKERIESAPLVEFPSDDEVEVIVVQVWHDSQQAFVWELIESPEMNFGENDIAFGVRDFNECIFKVERSIPVGWYGEVRRMPSHLAKQLVLEDNAEARKEEDVKQGMEATWAKIEQTGLEGISN